MADACECSNEPSGSVKCGDFLTGCKPVSSSGRTLHRGVSKLLSSEGYVSVLPISFHEGDPCDMLALGVGEFHRPRRRSAVTAPTTTTVLSPLPLGLSMKLKFLAQYFCSESRNVCCFAKPQHTCNQLLYVNSEFHNVTLCLRLAPGNCGYCG